jgi:hypothetical protein
MADNRNIVFVFNGRQNVFPIGNCTNFNDLCASNNEVDDLMKNSEASFMLNKVNYTRNSNIPSRAEVSAALAQKRLTNPSYLYDEDKLIFNITPLKVKQGTNEFSI